MPYAVASDGKQTAWVSLWNTSAIAELNLASGVVHRIELDTPKGSPTSSGHATAMISVPSRHTLYITLANLDEVVVLDTATSRVVSRVNVRLPKQRAGGAYPNALALSLSGKLYVAEAGTNSVAVLPLGKHSELALPSGFIPTEYYPTALAFAGNELIIGSGKGKGTGPNAGAPDPESKNTRSKKNWKYIGELTYGSVASLTEKEIASNLVAYSAQVMRNNLVEESQPRIDFRNNGHEGNPIHHVIYIIKENRTYDQLFGDLDVGDGDPSLAMFGEAITPNHHKLARQFGVLDNFYDSGEISGNGHVWSTAAITSDYTEKIWPINYRNNRAHATTLRGWSMASIHFCSTSQMWMSLRPDTYGRTPHAPPLRYRHYGELSTPSGAPNFRMGELAGLYGNAVQSPAQKKSIAPSEPLPEGWGSPWQAEPVAMGDSVDRAQRSRPNRNLLATSIPTLRTSDWITPTSSAPTNSFASLLAS